MERDLKTLMSRNGVEVIGAAQRTIAYTAVADGGNGRLKYTAAGHGLKKNQTIYVSTGAAYTGVKRVLEIVDANTFLVAGTFGSTTSGNIVLTASLNGEGFIVDSAPTIAEFEPDEDHQTIDPATVIAKTYVVGQEVMIPFKKIRITAGNITVIRKSHVPPVLDYTNR